MTIEISTAVTDPALAVLSYRYAVALDHRDTAALTSVFHPQAILRATPVGRNPMTVSTHRELPKIITAVEHWPRTFHVIGHMLHQVRDDHAVGEVYCVAHHFSTAQPGEGDDYVMYIRYLDRYLRGSDGGWLIARRDVVTDAVERRDVTAGGP